MNERSHSWLFCHEIHDGLGPGAEFVKQLCHMDPAFVFEVIIDAHAPLTGLYLVAADAAL